MIPAMRLFDAMTTTERQSTDNTGMARGSLRPIIYFERKDGFKILAPYDKDRPEIARYVYERAFKPLSFEWREAGTWGEWIRLQDDLIKQETRDGEGRKEKAMASYDAGRKRTASTMMQRRISSDCSAFERDFIDEWLKRAETKRREFMKRFDTNSYLWAVEQDASRKIEDRIPEPSF